MPRVYQKIAANLLILLSLLMVLQAPHVFIRQKVTVVTLPCGKTTTTTTSQSSSCSSQLSAQAFPLISFDFITPVLRFMFNSDIVLRSTFDIVSSLFKPPRL